ncbi:MAG: hypothetical protein DYG99_14760 [Bacteroidetes bacterium CHB5]|nr:hypothetical protein [Bacteroidetes bacterium CHB5]
MQKILTLSVILFLGFTFKAFSQTVYTSPKGEKYHTADCRLSGEASPVKLTDAKKAGKGACDICKPNELGKARLNQCNGKTADGTRCKRMTANKNKKCFQHQPK